MKTATSACDGVKLLRARGEESESQCRARRQGRELLVVVGAAHVERRRRGQKAWKRVGFFSVWREVLSPFLGNTDQSVVFIV